MAIYGDGTIFSGWVIPVEGIDSTEGCPDFIQTGGEIEIEPDRWQLISIPIRYGYWDTGSSQLIHDGVTVARVKNYVMDQIEDIYGGNAEDYIEVVNAYFGDNDFFYNYIPGVTNPLSPHNFELTFVDGARLEVTGFWVKSVHSSSLIIKWGDA